MASSSERSFRIPARLRPTVERFARTVCPPALSERNLLPELMVLLEQHLGVLPPHARLGVLAGFATLDEAARLHPAGRGRRFAHLDDAAADACFRTAARLRVSASIVKLIKGLVTFNYYEIPAVKAELGFHPDAYIARVARRRLDSYLGDIRKGDEAVLAPDSTAGPTGARSRGES